MIHRPDKMLLRKIYSLALLNFLRARRYKFLERYVKGLSEKQWLWTLILALPLTFYIVELAAGDVQLSFLSFAVHTTWSVIGVLIGYLLSTKVMCRFRHVKGLNILAFGFLMLFVIAISLLINLTGIRELNYISSTALILPLVVVAITFNSIVDTQNNL